MLRGQFLEFLKPLTDERRSAENSYQNFSYEMVAVNVWTVVASVYQSIHSEITTFLVAPPLGMATIGPGCLFRAVTSPAL